MIITGIKDAIRNGNKELRKLYQFKNSMSYLEYYLSFDDRRIFDSILSGAPKKSVAYQYFKALKKRRLPKRLFHSKVELLIRIKSEDAASKIENLRNNKCRELDKLKKTISNSMNLNPLFTDIQIFSLKDPLTMRNQLLGASEEQIRVRKENGITNLLENESVLFKNILSEELGMIYISVFGIPKEKAIGKSQELTYKRIEQVLIDYFGG